MNWVTELADWGNNAYTLAHSEKDPKKAANLRASSAIFWMMAERLAARPPWFADEAQVAALLDTAYGLSAESGLKYQNAQGVAALIGEYLRTP